MRVVIVVPALAEGKERHPPIIPWIIASGKTPGSPQVSGGIYEPGGVEYDYNTNATDPEKEWPASDSVKDRASKEQRSPMIVVQRDIKRLSCEIGRILAHEPRIVLSGFTKQEPAGMSPPDTVTRRMRISMLIGVLVVEAVSCYPCDRAAFEGHSSAESQKIFYRLR